MISEKDVRDLMGEFPQGSWLRKYVAYASKLSTTPMAYHICVGLGVLSTIVPDHGGTPYAGGITPCTFYGMIIGRSGDDQKSTALKIGKRILLDADSALIGDMPASAEGAVDSLAEKNKQALFYSEMGNFLSATKSGYGEAIKTLFTDLWDGTPQQRAKSGEVIRCERPRLNLVGACATKYLEKFTTEEDWHGGFLSRWFFIHAQREREDSYPMRKVPQGREWLIGTLRNKIDLGMGRCTGIDDEFYELWDKWYHQVQKMVLPKIITGLRTRIPAHCLRISHLIAFDNDWTKSTGNYLLNGQSLKLAIKITEMYIKSLISISEVLSFDNASKLRKKIISIIEKDGSAQYGNILKETKTTQKSLNDALSWLIATEDIKCHKFANTKIYQIKKSK